MVGHLRRRLRADRVAVSATVSFFTIEQRHERASKISHSYGFTADEPFDRKRIRQVYRDMRRHVGRDEARMFAARLLGAGMYCTFGRPETDGEVAA